MAFSYIHNLSSNDSCCLLVEFANYAFDFWIKLIVCNPSVECQSFDCFSATNYCSNVLQILSLAVALNNMLQ